MGIARDRNLNFLVAFLLFWGTIRDCMVSAGKDGRRGRCAFQGRRIGVHLGSLPTLNTWIRRIREKIFSRGSNGCEHSRNQPSDQACSLAGRRFEVQSDNLPTPNTWSKHRERRPFLEDPMAVSTQGTSRQIKQIFRGELFARWMFFIFLGESFDKRELC